MSRHSFFKCDGCGDIYDHPPTCFTFEKVWHLSFGNPYIENGTVSKAPDEYDVDLCGKCFEATGLDLILSKARGLSVTKRSREGGSK